MRVAPELRLSQELAANASALDAFVAGPEAAGSASYETEFVRVGTALQVVKVESVIG